MSESFARVSRHLVSLAFLTFPAWIVTPASGSWLPAVVATPSQPLASSLVLEPKQTPASVPAEETKRQSRLELGKGTPTGAGEVSIPLQFHPAPNATVGRIRAEIRFPQAWGQFRKVELPRDVPWKISVKRRTEKSAEQRSVSTILELTVSAGSRAITEGLIGHLRFSPQASGAGSAAAPVIQNVETLPPEPERVPRGSTEDAFPMSADPPLNPGVACFFYSH